MPRFFRVVDVVAAAVVVVVVVVVAIVTLLGYEKQWIIDLFASDGAGVSLDDGADELCLKTGSRMAHRRILRE